MTSRRYQDWFDVIRSQADRYPPGTRTADCVMSLVRTANVPRKPRTFSIRSARLYRCRHIWVLLFDSWIRTTRYSLSIGPYNFELYHFRSASSQEWQKVLVEEEDREELGVMTSRNGHICQQKRHCSWPRIALSIMPPTFATANKAPTTTTISKLAWRVFLRHGVGYRRWLLTEPASRPTCRGLC